MSASRITIFLLALALAACAAEKSPSVTNTTVTARDTTGAPFAYERMPLDTTHVPGTVIDSVFPMPEMIRRFRLGLPSLSALQRSEMSQSGLVKRFVTALAASDKITLGQLVLSRAEFAFLYFPNSRDALVDNGLSPQRRWDQITLNSEKGIARALTRLGGKPLALESFACPTPPVKSGMMTLQDGCTLKLRLADGSGFSGPLFGSVIEYAGRFKFVSYTNDM